MSDTIDDFKYMANKKKRLRAIFGVNCPHCVTKRPKAHPTILLPQQRCRLDGYKDQRPELTNEQWSAA